MTSRDLNILGAKYLENGWRYRLGYNGLPIGNDPLGFEWSRESWRRVTQKGEGHGPKIFRAHDLDDGWRYGLGANRAPIGNDYWELNGYVNDDVAWAWMVKIVTLRDPKGRDWYQFVIKFQRPYKQESRAAARKPRDAASVLFRWSSPTTFTTSIKKD